MVYEDYGATRDKKMMVNQNKIFTSNLYQEIFNVSRNTASRHLNELVELEQVQKNR